MSPTMAPIRAGGEGSPMNLVSTLTAEDNVRSGGFGAAVLEALAPAGLAGKVRVAALPDGFLPHGKQAAILAEHGLDPDGLARTVRSALAERTRAR